MPHPEIEAQLALHRVQYAQTVAAAQHQMELDKLAEKRRKVDEELKLKESAAKQDAERIALAEEAVGKRTLLAIFNEVARCLLLEGSQDDSLKGSVMEVFKVSGECTRIVLADSTWFSMLRSVEFRFAKKDGTKVYPSESIPETLRIHLYQELIRFPSEFERVLEDPLDGPFGGWTLRFRPGSFISRFFTGGTFDLVLEAPPNFFSR